MTKVLMRYVILQAGRVVRVGEIIVCAPKEAKAYLEEKGKRSKQDAHSTAVFKYKLADIYAMNLIQG